MLSTLDVEDDLRFGQVHFADQDVNDRVELIETDITTLHVDAITNAARPSLLGGGGVDGAIHRKAGAQLLQACKLLNGCDYGQVRITGGYDLPCRYIFHTVAPTRDVHNEHERKPLLQACYQGCLQLATQMDDVNTIALCCLGIGAYRYPAREAAHFALKIIREWLEQNKQKKVILVTYTKRDTEMYRNLMTNFYFPSAD
eukprot:Lithocolla_globosa_v1_NODE_9777_length_669_cov_106.540717.p1 type:complete len:200 gc:universal NODE_9777_length_669_cov_106.540717:64-663(+)